MKKRNLTSRQIKALETRKVLFDTARALFTEKGFDTVSVDEIVAKAGTSKGSFYTHFKSKEMVLIDEFRQIDAHHVEVFKSLPSGQTATEKLVSFVTQTYTYVAEEIGIDIVRIVYINQIKHDAQERCFIDEHGALFRIVRTILDEGRKSGEFRTDISAGDLTRMVVRCMRGTLYDWCLYEGRLDLVDDGEKFCSIFMKGIQNQTPPGSIHS